MHDYYSVLRAVHIGAAIASGSLFAFRAISYNLWGASWPKRKIVRAVTWIVDSVLLAAALLLASVIGQYPFVDAWLSTKVVLLVIYIAFGVLALSPRGNRRSRILSTIAAVGTFTLIFGVARAHHPLGVFSTW